MRSSVLSAVLVMAMAAACEGGGDRMADRPGVGGDTAAGDTTAGAAGAAARQVAAVRDLQRPESVRYDEELDVWYVANINGEPLGKDNNGFIARLKADGTMDALDFVQGGKARTTLHAPKGMAIVGDTLWVADIDVVRGFNKRTGEPVATVTFGGRAKFLNDIAVGPDGALYVTDSGLGIDDQGGFGHPGPDRIFRIGPDRAVTIALESPELAAPNGIVWDSAGQSFIVVAFNGPSVFRWAPGEQAPRPIGTGPGQQDGVVLLDGRILVTAWADSSVFALTDGKPTRVVSGVPSPADLGVDAKRHRIAVPLMMENRVEIWELAAR